MKQLLIVFFAFYAISGWSQPAGHFDQKCHSGVSVGDQIAVATTNLERRDKLVTVVQIKGEESNGCLKNKIYLVDNGFSYPHESVLPVIDHIRDIEAGEEVDYRNGFLGFGKPIRVRVVAALAENKFLIEGHGIVSEHLIDKIQEEGCSGN